MDDRSSLTPIGALVRSVLATILCCSSLTPAPALAASPIESTSVAKYVRLSYRPERPIPLLELPANFWTVQLVALSSKEALEAYARTNNLQDMSAARIANDGAVYYALLLGVYESRALAEEATKDMPAPFDELDGWIRSLKSLQSAMAAADRLIGSDDF